MRAPRAMVFLAFARSFAAAELLSAPSSIIPAAASVAASSSLSPPSLSSVDSRDRCRVAWLQRLREWWTRRRQNSAQPSKAKDARWFSSGDKLSTDEKLNILQIGWTQQDYAKYIDATRPFKPEQVELLVQAGKDIRTAFTHRFGEPTDRLNRVMCDEPFEDLGFRMINGEFEVTLWGARKMLEAIELRAVIIDQKKSLWPYTRSAPSLSGEQ
jgi:hypothetical protein